MLDASLLKDAVSDAADSGYNWVSLSGGEPLMYPPLAEVLQHARRAGLQTAIATNGMLLDARRLDAIGAHVDLIAISVDGTPASHNSLRASPRAFELMASRLAALRERNLNFGFIFTLTQHNLHELQWVVRFALDEGAKLVQVHPLDEVGHAAEHLHGACPDDIETAYAWLFGRLMQKQLDDKLSIQMDLVSSETLKLHPATVFAAPPDDNLSFAEIASPLVIEADATVVPLQYGFPRDYALGNLRQAPLRSLMRTWRSEREAAFYRLCAEAHERIVAAEKPYFLSWYDSVARWGRQQSATVADRAASA